MTRLAFAAGFVAGVLATLAFGLWLGLRGDGDGPPADDEPGGGWER